MQPSYFLPTVFFLSALFVTSEPVVLSPFCPQSFLCSGQARGMGEGEQGARAR
jgi:hypothetical protein